ncbi:hypothetical protein G6F43_012689 [Rhizopus delemar]|nr:hypothetical protein G6F43_012689 [Rhizopus delemar]
MVCSSHVKCPQDKFLKFEYPGDMLSELENLNYREKTVLSPVRLMTQITRKSTLYNGVIGHYEMRGAVFTTPSYEFAEMAYGGTLGLFYQRDDPAKINKDKVVAAYSALQRTHPLIARYQLPKLTYELVNYHIIQNKKHVGVEEGWTNNILFSNDDINPQATDVEFNDLLIGRDMRGNMVKYSHPSLLALVFPYLYTDCKGHYSLVTLDGRDTTDNNPLLLPEERGGAASATIRGETMVDYTKSRLMLKDRRFAMDPSFIFFMLDVLEKKNIAAANRFVVSTKKRLNGNRLKQKDVFDNKTGKMNKNIVSTVPSQIRSSYSYKRTNFLDLQCIFNSLGAPQLFMTFTCNDRSADFNNLFDNGQHPWEDPVLFAAHWKRKWQKFFQLGYGDSGSWKPSYPSGSMDRETSGRAH